MQIAEKKSKQLMENTTNNMLKTIFLLSCSCLMVSCATTRIDDHSYHHNDKPASNTTIVYNYNQPPPQPQPVSTYNPPDNVSYQVQIPVYQRPSIPYYGGSYSTPTSSLPPMFQVRYRMYR